MSLASGAGEGSAGAVYTVLVGIALAAGLTIALVFELTGERVAAEQARLQSQAVLDVLPGAVRWQGFGDAADGSLRPVGAGGQAPRLYAGYDAGGRLVGFAIAADGMGYQDRIRLLYGVDRAAGKLLGLRVLESRETPGLGARIADDAGFLASFRGLALELNGGEPRPLRLTSGPGSAAGVDAITGATVSCQAVVRIVSDSLARWWPRLAGAERWHG